MFNLVKEFAVEITATVKDKVLTGGTTVGAATKFTVGLDEIYTLVLVIFTVVAVANIVQKMIYRHQDRKILPE